MNLSVRSAACGYDPAGLLFTGKERDAETGLDYFGARYINSSQGRFTSPDAPFADQHPENPQSWNLYAYTQNNPLRYVDPTGRFAEPSEGKDCGVKLKDCAPTIGPRKLPSGDDGPLQRVGNAGIGWLKKGLSDLVGLMSGDNPTNAVQDLQWLLMPSNERQQAGANANNIFAIFSIVGAAKSLKAASLLKKSLASEQQMGEILSGAGSVIAGPGGRVALRDAARLAEQYGGKAADWVKVASTNFKAADGTSFEIHAYKNLATGTVVELKTKFQ